MVRLLFIYCIRSILQPLFVGSFFYFIIFAFEYMVKRNLNKTKRLHTRPAAEHHLINHGGLDVFKWRIRVSRHLQSSVIGPCNTQYIRSCHHKYLAMP